MVSNWVLFYWYIVILSKNVSILDAAKIEEYPLVGYDDYPPDIPLTAQKSYTTTVGLIPREQDTVFDERRFIDSAIPYYSSGAGLSGYIHLDDVKPNKISNNLVLVTYTVRYTYVILLQSAGVSDAKIANTIGNYAHVQNGIKYQTEYLEDRLFGSREEVIFQDPHMVFLETEYAGSGSPINQDFDFQSSDENFVFTGGSICSDERNSLCNASNVLCVETLNGVNMTCMSPCKNEYCQNDGECMQKSPNVTPVCLCPSNSEVWHFGEHCSTKVSLWMVILGIVLFALTIVIAIFMSICCCLENRKNKKMESSSEQIEFKVINGRSNSAYFGDFEDVMKRQSKDQATQTASQKKRRHAYSGLAARRHHSRAPSRRENYKHRRHRSKDSESYNSNNKQNRETPSKKQRSSSRPKGRSSRRKSYERERKSKNRVKVNTSSSDDPTLSTTRSGAPYNMQSSSHNKESSERVSNPLSNTLRWLPVKQSTGTSTDHYNSLSPSHHSIYREPINPPPRYELESMV